MNGIKKCYAKYKILQIVIGCILLGSTKVVYAQYDALTNLEVRHVELQSWVRGESYSRLYDRAIKKLTEAGIFQSNCSRKIPNRQPTLKLIFDAIDLSQSGPNALFGNVLPGKWLYMQKLELWDNVYTKRNSEKQIWVTTWTVTIRLPIIVDDVPIKNLESDLDELLRKFIADYRQANPGKKQGDSKCIE